jgi:hypothetical protein
MLNTDKFFWDALRTDASVTRATGGRIFNTARPTIEEKQDRVPYVIITFDSLTNDETTKDDEPESPYDSVKVSLLCVANVREQLARLTQAVRDRNRDYMLGKGDSYGIEDWQFSAGAVMYDELKPCFYQSLNYNVTTLKTN